MAKKVSLALLAVLFGFVTASCGGTTNESSSADSTGTSETTESTNSGTSTDGTSSSATAVVASVVANAESFTLKIGDMNILTDYYTINSATGSKLTAAQKSCTYTSSDETILKIVNKSLHAVGTGTATITVTSKVDKTKTCDLNFTVKDVYFSRDVGYINSEDDFTNELIADGGTVETKSKAKAEFYVKGVEATKFMITSKFKYVATRSDEYYPKVGFITNTFDNTKDENNCLYYFLDMDIGTGTTPNLSYRNFGVCERRGSSSYAWDSGVAPTYARYKIPAYTLAEDSALTLGSEWTMTMIRDGLDFHMFVNDTYVFSMTTLSDLFGNNDGAVNSMVGFFEFNSDIVFSNYSVVTDETTIQTKIDSVTTKTYIDSWNNE